MDSNTFRVCILRKQDLFMKTETTLVFNSRSDLNKRMPRYPMEHSAERKEFCGGSVDMTEMC